jgi:hypothetical protein
VDNVYLNVNSTHVLLHAVPFKVVLLQSMILVIVPSSEAFVDVPYLELCECSLSCWCLVSANFSVQRREIEMVSDLESMEGAAYVMPLSRNSCMLCVCVCVCVAAAETGGVYLLLHISAYM